MWHRYEEGIPSARIFAGSTSQAQVIKVTNVKFMSFFNLDGRLRGLPPNQTLTPVTINRDFVDIQIAQRQHTEIENCARVVSNDGGLDRNWEHGIFINKYDGAPLTEWNEYAWLLSRKGRIFPDYNVEMDHYWQTSPQNPQGVVTLLNAGISAPRDEIAWEIAVGTYWYGMRVIFDRPRMIGLNTPINTNVSASPGQLNGVRGVLINMSWNGNQPGGWERMYRGTTNSTSDWTHFADIPVIHTSQFMDSGTHINGYPWQTRAAAEAETYYPLPTKAMIHWRGENVTLTRMSALPTIGAWKVGDKIEFTNGQTYICTVGGTPGTWKLLNSEIIGGSGTITSAAAMPTLGSFVRGSVVLNTTPTVVAGKITIGWTRLTTGSNHVAGTDWSPMVVSTS